jgi:hypothetical protein
MHARTVRHYAAGIALGISVLTGGAFAQELNIGRPNREVLCPHPATLQLSATATPSVNPTDFPTPLPAGQGVRVLGQAASNQVFRYTFNWKVPDKLCCEITRATLTVVLRWFGSAGPSTAGNDTISIVNGGTSVPGMGGYIWGGNIAGNTTSPTPYTANTVPTMQTKTVVFDLASVLNNMTQLNRLSFAVQDDSTVVSAVLQLNGCCVNH